MKLLEDTEHVARDGQVVAYGATSSLYILDFFIFLYINFLLPKFELYGVNARDERGYLIFLSWVKKMKLNNKIVFYSERKYSLTTYVKLPLEFIFSFDRDEDI